MPDELDVTLEECLREASNHTEERDREDRERRSRTACTTHVTSNVSFTRGNRVLHDVLGEGTISKEAREVDGKVLFMWCRETGAGKKRRREFLNRWVEPRGLKKLTSESADGEGVWRDIRGDIHHGEVEEGTSNLAEQVFVSCDLPRMAHHERSRCVKQKAPIGKRGRNESVHITKETNVPLTQRLQEFPNTGLTISAGKLFCLPCKIVLDNLKGKIDDHVKRQKHLSNLERWHQTGNADGILKEQLSAYFKSSTEQKSSSLDVDAHVFRYRCVETFLATGTPLERLDAFRPLLERSGIALGSSSDMRSTYIPRIEQYEAERLKEECQDQFIASPFDGTTRLGELIAQTGRWCTSDFQLCTRLLMLKTTQKHTNHAELASLLTINLAHHLCIPAQNVVCLPRDGCSTNGAAMRLMLANPFINAIDSMCFCHILSLCGERINLPVLSSFTTPWLELVGGRDPHHGAKNTWASLVHPAKVPGYSKVRWYSKAEIQFVQAENAHQLAPFMRILQQRGIGDATTRKMVEILQSQGTQLMLELAGMLDIRSLVRTTYELEGDRLEVLLLYSRIETLRSLGRSLRANADGILPNADAVLRARVKLDKNVTITKVFPGYGSFAAEITKWETVESTLYPGQERLAYQVKYFADGKVEDLEEEELRPLINVTQLPERQQLADRLSKAFDYLESRVTGSCDPQYDASHWYRICGKIQVFNPQFAASHLNQAWVDSLAEVTPLATLVDLRVLKQELPVYLAAAATFHVDESDVQIFSDAVLQWWKTRANTFPEWKKAARIVFAFTPSSASVERVFAKVRNLFGDNQMQSLADVVRASTWLSYNKRVVV